MFNKNEFNAMLARKGITKDELAKKLGIRRETLYRRIVNGGNFNYKEIILLIEEFGKEEVMKALFS